MRLFKNIIIFLVLIKINCFSNGQRSYLTFGNSAVFKIVVGVGVPVKLNEKGKSLSWFTNLQAKFKLPEIIDVLVPDEYETGRSVKHHLNGDLFYEALNNIIRRLKPMTTDEDFLRLICGASHTGSDDYQGLLEDIWPVIRQQIFKSVKLDVAGACRRNSSAVDECRGCGNYS